MKPRAERGACSATAPAPGQRSGHRRRAHLEQQHHRRAGGEHGFRRLGIQRAVRALFGSSGDESRAGPALESVRRGVEFLENRSAARAIYGRSIAHVLKHSGSFDATALDELLGAYEHEGVR